MRLYEYDQSWKNHFPNPAQHASVEVGTSKKRTILENPQNLSNFYERVEAWSSLRMWRIFQKLVSHHSPTCKFRNESQITS